MRQMTIFDALVEQEQSDRAGQTYRIIITEDAWRLVGTDQHASSELRKMVIAWASDSVYYSDILHGYVGWDRLLHVTMPRERYTLGREYGYMVTV